jgi:hypothetical protein
MKNFVNPFGGAVLFCDARPGKPERLQRINLLATAPGAGRDDLHHTDQYTLE